MQATDMAHLLGAGKKKAAADPLSAFVD